MENITKEFTYSLADDQYSQTNNDQKTATLEYTGPAKKYITVDAESNKLIKTASISEDSYETYNDTNTDTYAIEVDCDKDTLICALYDGAINADNLSEIAEEIPGCDVDYVRSNPSLPDHTYEVSEIVYDRSNNSFVKPLPWKAPHMTWLDLMTWRNVQLKNGDRVLSDDLPDALYAEVSDYKQYLRDFPVTFGASWDIQISEAGTGYTVGDQLLICDPAYKKNSPAASDILLTVTSTNETGGITGINKSSAYAYEYHTDAGTYNSVFYTSSATGTGATFNMSKVKTVGPWKITPKENPIA